jgi:hypothetical protein
MTLTVRSASVTGATTAARALTHAEMDANWAHVIESSNQNFTPSGSGAVARSVQEKLRGTVSFNDFGVSTSETGANNATYMQAAVDAAITAGAQKLILENTGSDYDLADKIIITGATDLEIDGCGAYINRTTDTTATSVFQLISCTRVKIHGFRIKGEHSATVASTGSNPPIQVGDDISETDDTLNTDIEIFDNYIEGGNHAGILVVGWHGTDSVVKNRGIRIYGNTVRDSSMGIFVYKNAEDVQIFGNLVDTTAQHGIFVDTCAATDANLVSEACNDIVIANNVVRRAGQREISAGIDCKGDINKVSISGNVIRDVGTDSNANICYGILIIADNASSPSTGSQVVITGNVIENISSSGTGEWSLYVGTGWEQVAIIGNSISDADRGIQVDGATDVVIVGNVLKNLGKSSPGFSISIGLNDTFSGGLITGNVIIDGDGAASHGINLGAGATNLDIGLNYISGFSTGGIAQSSSATGIRRHVINTVSADKGDAAATLTYGDSESTNVWNTPLTMNRGVTLATNNCTNGAKFKIVRTAAATGASNLNVGTGPLAALAPGEWCEVEYDGSAWILTAFGALS